MKIVSTVVYLVTHAILYLRLLSVVGTIALGGAGTTALMGWLGYELIYGDGGSWIGVVTLFLSILLLHIGVNRADILSSQWSADSQANNLLKGLRDLAGGGMSGGGVGVGGGAGGLN